MLELFSGAGGATLGYLAAGLEVVRCVEWDASADATAKAAGHPSVCGDVRSSEVYEGLPPIDILHGSPPCQAFSSAGKRLGAMDERNGWPWTLDAIDFLRACGRGPTWVICENVVGLTHHRADCTGKGPPESCAGCYWLRSVVPAFERRFASVQTTILDAADYGVPQRRHRVFLVGGPRQIRWPEPTHADPATLAQGALFGPKHRPWRTVRQALGLGLCTIGQRTPETARGGNVWSSPDAPSVTVPAVAGGISGRGTIPQSRRPLDVDAPADAVRGSGDTDPSVRGVRPTPDTEPAPAVTGGSNLYARSRPELLDIPSPTVTAIHECKGASEGSHPEKMNGACDAVFAATGIRRLTVREVPCLQDFPPDYPWQGTKSAQYRQVGNAICSTVARVLGEAVLRAARSEAA